MINKIKAAMIEDIMAIIKGAKPKYDDYKAMISILEIEDTNGVLSSLRTIMSQLQEAQNLHKWYEMNMQPCSLVDDMLSLSIRQTHHALRMIE